MTPLEPLAFAADDEDEKDDSCFPMDCFGNFFLFTVVPFPEPKSRNHGVPVESKAMRA